MTRLQIRLVTLHHLAHLLHHLLEVVRRYQPMHMHSQPTTPTRSADGFTNAVHSPWVFEWQHGLCTILFPHHSQCGCRNQPTSCEVLHPKHRGTTSTG